MKKLIAIFIMITVAFAAMPAFAKQASQPAAQPEVTFFQKASDSLANTGKTSGKNPSAWVAIFQKASDNIATWDKTTNDAKSMSLRGNEGEIARRRAIPQ